MARNPNACTRRNPGLGQLLESLPSRQDQQIRQARKPQSRQALVLCQFTPRPHRELARAETRVTDCRSYQGGVEATTLFCADRALPLFEIDRRMTDAFQAPQGPLGPFRSQWSRHAVDAKVGFLDLSNSRPDSHPPGQACHDERTSDSSNPHLISFLTAPEQLS